MEIPASLRAWFIADFVLNVAVGLPLLFAPEEILSRVGWTSVDPVSPRLLAAALLAIGVQSWRQRNGGSEVYRAMLGLKTVGSTIAIIALTIAIARGAPSLTFVLLSACLGFCGVWSHYAIRLRQQQRAETRENPSETDDASDSDDDHEAGTPTGDPGQERAL